MLSFDLSKYFSKENVIVALLSTLLVAIFLIGFFLIWQVTNHLPTDIRELKTELKTDIRELKTELKTDIRELKTELKTDIRELKTDIKGLNNKVDNNHNELKNLLIEYLGKK